ncbi:hypothetical protein D8B34_01005 [Verminephrobacter eiseniae]|nr:hypothetical protein [Verminephrobacter eiseniae]MCW8184583.1 hypothetical protein [Verminephrobacter eiseniae]MCW8223259.1 hypothetical protein [Verminephrobacter eiseniae]MCW8232436.1 hypothetical protein [Verminephrobacter eiseniae]
MEQTGVAASRWSALVLPGRCDAAGSPGGQSNTARRGESNGMPQGQGGDDALGGDESRASTEGATDKPANDGALHESDPANDDIAAQFPLTDGGILDIAGR